MADNGKKRTNSFRRLFPSLFFPHKSKDKNINKGSQGILKSPIDNPSNSNQYENPRTAYVKSNKNIQSAEQVDERIYENLTVMNVAQNASETVNNDASSNHSSSSTLVSESIIKSKFNCNMDNSEKINSRKNEHTNYAARPQVPPKPYNDFLNESHNRSDKINDSENSYYPGVYYHSLEKLSDKISPLDEIEIYKASQTPLNPASVGAEIKRVSTKFLISPKKEAEVRTIQPIRARSLSFDNNKEKPQENNSQSGKPMYINKENSKKPYNYSAPTSPIPTCYKIPNMPKTVSPYEHVRKTMIETEEKRNSLNRSSIRNKLTSSPRLHENNDETKTVTDPQQNDKVNNIQKEKTRQKVEAFYWQKLKELKQKEDEYFLRQSINSAASPTRYKPYLQHTYSNLNCNTSNSTIIEPRSLSLPRGTDFKSYCMNQPIYSRNPFARGAPERRTDTFIRSRCSYDDPDVMYRHPEKLYSMSPTASLKERKQMPIFQRGSLTHEAHNSNQQPKRVSFEEFFLYQNMDRSDIPKNTDVNLKVKSDNYEQINPCNEIRSPNISLQVCNVSKGHSKGPPRPPVRTTSVGKSISNNKNIVQLASGSHSVYSESESGSEAGEIQRILQRNARKETTDISKIHFDIC